MIPMIPMIRTTLLALVLTSPALATFGNPDGCTGHWVITGAYCSSRCVDTRTPTTLERTPVQELSSKGDTLEEAWTLIQKQCSPPAELIRDIRFYGNSLRLERPTLWNSCGKTYLCVH